MVALSVIVIVLLIGVLAGYLFVVGGQLTRIASNLEECRDLAVKVLTNAKLIDPGLDHINRTGGVVAGALPLLYGMAEGIVAGVTPREPAPVDRRPARPAQGRRRSRLLAGVGYVPPGTTGANGPQPAAPTQPAASDG
ncbi:hypothetical protein I6A84_06095 [Frankia sp. CNm7]|uniref:Uncharacterized protein n=1 Tax=Frankia nepalensis TaxID=1836974 RepID=A0A937UQ75_9ACTN|nr:hypothetical protein [Frankia nepalensis]MBL7499316.1 hypothetical protein [Frankia nepalensis]MBL7512699.1 hypothetical protein [Frankia nepalensis]MBL7517707.1 hypothetical protein [Frankia nepalensis]MBL7629912.1 hypothetical protein [Frankia nepalensis]